MKLPKEFDFVVVYSNENAHSAADKSYTGHSPFSSNRSHASCNTSYAYLLQYARRIGVKAAFATIDDVSGPGEFSSYWTFNNNWKRVRASAQTQVVFDKFSRIAKEQTQVVKQLLGPEKQIALFHNHEIKTLFGNKLTTHKTLGEYMLPTVAINVGSAKTIGSAKHALKNKVAKHAHGEDFSDELVLKGISSVGGDQVYKVRTDARFKKIAAEGENVQFLLQPFIQAGDFNLERNTKRTDLRVVIGEDTMLQSYIRTAKKGEFRANASQGASVEYIAIDAIPQQVLDMIAKIQKTANLKHGLYTLDFMRSENGNLYLVEGNASPGLTWDDAEDERRAKQLIRIIVKQLQVMAEPKR